MVVSSTLVKLAGGPRRFKHEFSLEAVRHQYDDFEESATGTERLFAIWQEATKTHPDPIWRANAILQWAETAQYQDIMAGRYLRRSDVQEQQEPPIEGLYACPACDAWVKQGRDCHKCGLRLDDASRQRCSKGDVADVSWRYCRRCGEKLPG